jgi:DNA-directed RNA polymerase beta subunit
MTQERLNLSNFKLEDFPINLVEAQHNSYHQFLSEELQVLFQEISPIEDYTGESWLMEFGEVRLGHPKYSASDSLLLSYLL